MRILFIGGTGIISESCSRLAVERGFEVYLLNRGRRGIDIPGAHSIVADINNADDAREKLQGMTFDVVANFVAFFREQIERDVTLFTGKADQYIFISSASAYQKPVSHYLIDESTPLRNPHWQYSRDKIVCEETLQHAYRETGFPMTIVRPSLTYNRLLPLALTSWSHPYTIVDRIRKGKKIIVPGDGTSLWTITHSDDFAKAFVGLCGHQQAIGQAFHITSDEVMTWNQYYEEVGKAIDVSADLIHIPSDFIVKFLPWEEGNLQGDKAQSVVFDNSKVKRFVPGYVATITWAQGLRRLIAYLEADEKRCGIDEKANAQWDKIIAAYEGAYPPPPSA